MSLVTGVRIKKNGQVYLHDVNPSVDGILIGALVCIKGRLWVAQCRTDRCRQTLDSYKRGDSVDMLKQHYLRRHL